MEQAIRKQQFLDELATDTEALIAPAARRAGVHRATVYRWAHADDTFKAAIQALQQAVLDRRRAAYLVWDAERTRRRARRWGELRPQFQALAAYARSCKQQ